MIAYPATFLGTSSAAPWTDATICGAATAVPPHPTRAEFTLPAHKALVRVLRGIAGEVLTGWRLSGDELDSAVLIVGELAANAARHGRSEMTLRLDLVGDTLSIVVDDHGDPAPSRTPAANDDSCEHGRGLDIVHTLAKRVHLRYDQHGLRVVAELAVDTRSLPRQVL